MTVVTNLVYILFVVLSILFIVQFIYIQFLISHERKERPMTFINAKAALRSDVAVRKNDNRLRVYSFIVDVPSTLAISVILSNEQIYEKIKHFFPGSMNMVVTCATEVINVNSAIRQVNIMCVRRTASSEQLLQDILNNNITRLTIAGKSFMVMPMGLDYQDRYYNMLKNIYETQKNINTDVRDAMNDFIANFQDKMIVALLPVASDFFEVEKIYTKECSLPSEDFFGKNNTDLSNKGTAFIAHLLNIKTATVKTKPVFAIGYKTII